MNTQFSMLEMNNERIMFKCSRSIEFIEVKRIIRVESLRAYCRLYLNGDDSLVLSCPLRSVEDKLQNYPYFFKSHRSHLINLLYVKNYHTDNGIKLADGSGVPLALTMKTAFLEKMDVLFGCSVKRVR